MPEHTPAPTPHRAVYGFAIYLLFFTLFILYTMWSLLPTKEWGFTYLPDKYFAIMLPMVVLVGLAFFAFFIYPAINMSLTPEVDELASVVDIAIRRRDSGNAPVNSWNDLKSPPKTPRDDEVVKKGVDYCTLCKEQHPTVAMRKISTLRFMDLAEVNKDFFE